jgi:hypothetical protein
MLQVLIYDIPTPFCYSPEMLEVLPGYEDLAKSKKFLLRNMVFRYVSIF